MVPSELSEPATSVDVPISLGTVAGTGQLQSEPVDKRALAGGSMLEAKPRRSHH